MTAEMVCDPIYAGNTVRITGNFEDLDGDPADPTTVTLRVVLPDDTEIAPAPSSSVVGTWAGELVVTQHGEYRFRWEGDGALVAADENVFYVRESGLS